MKQFKALIAGERLVSGQEVVESCGQLAIGAGPPARRLPRLETWVVSHAAEKHAPVLVWKAVPPGTMIPVAEMESIQDPDQRIAEKGLPMTPGAALLECLDESLARAGHRIAEESPQPVAQRNAEEVLPAPTREELVAKTLDGIMAPHLAYKDLVEKEKPEPRRTLLQDFAAGSELLREVTREATQEERMRPNPNKVDRPFDQIGTQPLLTNPIGVDRDSTEHYHCTNGWDIELQGLGNERVVTVRISRRSPFQCYTLTFFKSGGMAINSVARPSS